MSELPLDSRSWLRPVLGARTSFHRLRSELSRFVRETCLVVNKVGARGLSGAPGSSGFVQTLALATPGLFAASSTLIRRIVLPMRVKEAEFLALLGLTSNNSFKPNPLRSFKTPFGFLGGSA